MKTIQLNNAPQGAQYAMLNPTGEFVQKIYKIEPVLYNDGTTSDVVYFHSEFEIWQPSEYTVEQFLNNPSVRIIQD